MAEDQSSFGYSIRMGAVDLYENGALRVSVPWTEANRLVVILSYYEDTIDMNPGDELAKHNLEDHIACEIDEREKEGVSFQPFEDGHRVLFKGQPCGWLTLIPEYYEIGQGYRSTPWRFTYDRGDGKSAELRRFGDELDGIDRLPKLMSYLPRQAFQLSGRDDHA